MFLFAMQTLGVARADEPSAAKGGASSASGVAVDDGAVSSLRFVNLRIKPLSLVDGIFGGEIEIGFLPRWLAVGASIDYFQNTTSNNSRTTYLYEYGVMASIYFFGERFKGGWLFQPGYRYLPLNTVQHLRGIDLSTPTYNYAITATVGREWAWQSGLNIHLGAGLATSPADDSRSIEPIAIWQLGFAI